MSADVLREAAALMREEQHVGSDWTACHCEESDQWFDRSICPEPCNSMHDICVECGHVKGFCPVAMEGRRAGNRSARALLAVADWLEHAAHRIETRGWVPTATNADALAVARAYLGTTP